MAKKARKIKRRYRKIRISFLGRELHAVNDLLRLCRLIGKIESLPKDMHTSDESPKVYILILRLKPGINLNKVTDVLLNTQPVRWVVPVK